MRAVIVSAGIAGASAQAAAPLPALPLSVGYDWTEDATREDYNSALRLAWGAMLGDWTDAAGARQGNQAFASLQLVDNNTERAVEWDVTNLVKAGGGEFLITRSGGTSFAFHSREGLDAAKRPKLVIVKDGVETVLDAVADTSLDATTYLSLGANPTLKSTGTMLLRFNVGADSAISGAKLRLTATVAQFGNQTLSVFRPNPRPVMPGALSLPLGSESDIILRIGGEEWRNRVNERGLGDRITINADGTATVSIPTGQDTGSDFSFLVPRGERRETMFMRMVMKVHSNWTATMGGKFPGLTNTGLGDRRATNVCAWGGREANGVCWSVRTNRVGYMPGTPFAETHMALSPYAYRFNRVTNNGEGPSFALPLEKTRFAVIDQMVKLNSIRSDGAANSDGEVAYWMNGALIGRMTGVVFRTRLGDDTLPSELWANVYEGGVDYLAPHPHSVTFGEMLVSKKLLPFDKRVLDRLNANGNQAAMKPVAVERIDEPGGQRSASVTAAITGGSAWEQLAPNAYRPVAVAAPSSKKVKAAKPASVKVSKAKPVAKMPAARVTGPAPVYGLFLDARDIR